jgi:hypothetical protein
LAIFSPPREKTVGIDHNLLLQKERKKKQAIFSSPGERMGRNWHVRVGRLTSEDGWPGR